MPFVDVANEQIAGSESVKVKVNFLAQRKALTFDAKLQNEIPEPQTLNISGHAGITPIKSANIKIMNNSGMVLFTTSTDDQGGYNAFIDKTLVDNAFIIEVSGGEVDGVPFMGTIKAVYDANDDLSNVNITTLTSIVSLLMESQNSSNAIEERALIIQNLIDIGLLEEQKWNSTSLENINIESILTLFHGNEFDKEVRLIAEDLEDYELSPENMDYFPNTHGGIISVSIGGGGKGSHAVFINQKVQIPINVNALAPKTTFKYVLESSADWVTISPEGIITLNPSERVEGNKSYPIKVSVVNEYKNIGRVIDSIIYVVIPKETKALIVDVDGGVINNDNGDITLSVPEGAVDLPVEIRLMTGIDDDGTEVITVDVNGTLIKPYTLTLPQLNKHAAATQNFSGKTRKTRVSQALKPNNFQKIKNNKTNNVSEQKSEDGIFTCREAEDNHWIMDRCWLDIEAYYVFGDLSITNEYARITDSSVSSQVALRFKKMTASQLWSSESIYAQALKKRTPVLFIHGFIPYYLGGGEGTYGNFQKFIADLDVAGKRFIPFEFQWRTSARFQDVAVDLAIAIRQIYQKTGQPVHIMTHSFGGVLTRTLLQNLATKPVDVTNMVASVTSFGSPYSGITDERETLHSVTFEQGQNSLKFEACTQISCFQMGEQVSFSGAAKKLINVKEQKGYIAAQLSKTACNLPNNLPYTVLMGIKVIGRGNAGGKRALSGDGLISYQGQRFLPRFTNSNYIASPLITEKLPQCNNQGAIVEERTLGFTEHIKPNALIPNSLQKSNYYWGYSHTGSGGEVNIQCASESNCEHDGWLSAKALLTKYVTEPIDSSELISSIDFDDSNFKACVLEHASTYNVTKIDQLGFLNCGSRNIYSTKGLERLTSLGSLSLGGNHISSIDVTSNKELLFLGLRGNGISSIDITKNLNLTGLDVWDNNLTELNVSKNRELDYIGARNNQLSALDVRNNLKLTNLIVDDNYISDINLLNNHKLSYLSIGSNNLSTLQLSSATKLRTLDARYNPLSSIDLGDVGDLETLILQGYQDSQLNDINIEGAANLKYLFLDGNNIQSINLDSNSNLDTVWLQNNPLTQVTIDYLQHIDWIPNLAF